MTRVFTARCLVVFLYAGLTVAATGQSSPTPPEQRDGSERAEPGRLGTSTVSPAPPVPGMPSAPPARSADHENTVGRPLLKHIALDQVGIWTSPRHLQLKDATWLVPLAGVTAGFFVTDAQFSRHLSNSPSTLNHYQNLSNYGTFSLAGVAGGMYLLGHFRGDDLQRETGFLGGEALIDSYLLTTVIKYGTGRQRPLMGTGRGLFFQNGTSFPSEHATAAWSVASVIAHEYPSLLTQVLAYGTASLVSYSRVRGKQHFPSDVLVGSGLGWLVGRYVYIRRHNPEFGGGPWEPLGVLPERGKNWAAKNMGSPYVPLDSWVYPALDRLSALGYLHSGFLGMRPWTRLECARLVSEADDPAGAGAAEEAPLRLLRSLEEEFASEVKLLAGGENRRLRLESVYTRFTNISGQPLRDGYHFGQTIVNDFGRPYAEGFNNVTGVSAWASDGPFVGYIRAEFQHVPSAPALPLFARQVISNVDLIPLPPATPVSQLDRFRLLDAYVGMTLENWEISFGKQSLWWGPGDGGPMTISNNVQPINMFRVNRVTALKLPGILGWLGPIRTEFFLGQLAGQEFIFSPLGLVGQFGRSLDPQPFIHGQKISFKPTPNFEFGFFRTTIYGGPGYPFTWHTFLRSVFSTGNTVAGTPNKPGKRTSGLDFTYRLPFLRNWLTFYGDGLAYDEFSPIAYADRSVWRAGLYLTHFPRLPKLDLRIEGVYTDNPLGGNLCCGFYYKNNTWRSGYTNDGNLLGSWIGREGQGAQAWTTYWLSPRNSIQFDYRHQKVSQEFIPGGGTVNDAGARASLWLRPDFSVTTSVQYEKWNFPVVANTTQTNVTASFGFAFWPGHRRNH